MRSKRRTNWLSWRTTITLHENHAAYDLWGLAVDGEQGVARALSLLRVEFDLAMALCGCRSIADITRDLLQLPRSNVAHHSLTP